MSYYVSLICNNNMVLYLCVFTLWPYMLLSTFRPEGGWEEPNELDMFANMGFQEVTLGTRVLRSDVAVVSLLALAHEICAGGR